MSNKIAIISNVNMDMLIRELSKQIAVYRTDGYGEWVRYTMGAERSLCEFAPSIIFVLLDGNALLQECESEEQGDKEILQAIGHISHMPDHYPGTQIFVSNLDICHERIIPSDMERWEDKWEYLWDDTFQAVVRKSTQIHGFDLKSLMTVKSHDQMYSKQLWYMGAIPYSLAGINEIKRKILEITEYGLHVRKKVLVLDLDNTLWGGVIGEDGTDGIVLGNSGKGACFRDAQKRIKEIKNTGVLLAIVSKNNPEDVAPVFSNNTGMVLKKDDFVACKINWRRKSENILELSKELNITTSDFVFIDDNPVEQEEVRSRISEINIVPFPKDVSKLPDTIRMVYEKYFMVQRLTEEDTKKTEMYQQENARNEVREQSGSMEDYLKKLQIRITLSELTDTKTADFDRTVQLIGKTNQFNTNTIRMNYQQVQNYLQDGGCIVTAHVKDRYGDNGLVAVVLIRAEDKSLKRVIIDNFLMSCRVMGRRIEEDIISAILQKYKDQGTSEVDCSYVPTAKNAPVADLWDKLGFIRIEKSEDSQKYVIKLQSARETDFLHVVMWR